MWIGQQGMFSKQYPFENRFAAEDDKFPHEQDAFFKSCPRKYHWTSSHQFPTKRIKKILKMTMLWEEITQHIAICWFPDIGLPPVIIHFRSGFSPYKPSIWRYPHGHGNVHLMTHGPVVWTSASRRGPCASCATPSVPALIPVVVRLGWSSQSEVSG